MRACTKAVGDMKLQHNGVTPNSPIVVISTPTTLLEFPYADLLRRPSYGFRNYKEWERWVRKIIKFAAQNGGWKLKYKEEQP